MGLFDLVMLACLFLIYKDRFNICKSNDNITESANDLEIDDVA